MNATNLTYADRMQFASDSFAAGDMIAYVAACWSCEVAPCGDDLIPWAMEQQFMAMDLTQLIAIVEDAMQAGRIARRRLAA